MVHCQFIVLTFVGWITLILTVVAGTEENRIDSVITSTHQIQMLYRSERSFVTQISDFADQLEELIDSIRIYSNSFEEIRPRQGGSQAMNNPIDAHLLIRHLAIGWPMLKSALDNLSKLIQTSEHFQTREEREKLPTKSDMESSETALIRLIAAYNLNTTKLVNGILASKTFEEIKSDRRLTVWDLGRVAIGLLNLKYFTPTVELLEESIRVIAENQDTRTTSPIKQQGVKFFVHPSPLIIPAIINENIRIEDLLDIKLTAMKEHDDILEKVIKKEIETCGDGLKTLPYNTRRVNKYIDSEARKAFQNAFKLQLNKTPSPLMEREQTMRLCRGQDLRKGVILSKLRCRLSRYTFPPIKLEEISINPSIIMAHEMMMPSQISQIIRLSASKLQGNGGGPSTSFKSAMLDEEDVDLAFIRRLEWITTTKAKPGSQSELSVVRNFGIAGTFGIHSDYRGEYNSHPIHGERLASIQLYLTPVKAGGYTVFPRIGAFVRPTPGSALIYWNVLSSGRPNYLTFNSDCPVVYGNKWVLHHWINAKANLQIQNCPIKETVLMEKDLF